MGDAERTLQDRLEEALAAADVDVGDLVEAAWAEARAEVQERLRGLMVRDLLRRACAAIAPETRPAPAPADGTGVYLLGITSADRAVPTDELPSIPGGGPLRVMRVGDLAVVVCDVELEVLAPLRDPHAGTLELLARVAAAHDAILATLADQGPILPLRLGTVLPDDATVTDVIGPTAPGLGAELERLEGHREWAVTVHLDAPAAEPDPRGAGPEATGRDYLEARRQALELRARRRDARLHLADELHGTLAARAADADRVTSRPVEDVAPPLLHGVYLVRDEAWTAFEAGVEELRAAHPDARIDLTGPWPPYHFTSVDVGAGS